MKYYIIQIGCGVYYNQKKDRFTSYKDSATWYETKTQVDKVLEKFEKDGIIAKVIDHEIDNNLFTI